MDTTSFVSFFVSGFHEGGFAVILITAAFAFALGLIIERTLKLYYRLHIDSSSFMFEIQKYILSNDFDGAIRMCNGTGTAALPKVIKAGLQRAGRSEEQIQNAIDAASLEQIPKLEKRLGYLAMIANVATLLGLLGTIMGLIRSFQAVALADPAQRQAILSAGISEAMFATAFGLITAIIAMIAHSVLSSRATKILEDIDEHGVKLMDLLAARKYKHGSEKGAE